jgi:hypothetical protein
MARDPKYWFPAKTYGWGWGPPTCWQGWAVVAAFVAVIVPGVLMLPPDRYPLGFVALLFLWSGLFTGVCWLTGEPPRWRWGNNGTNKQ